MKSISAKELWMMLKTAGSEWNKKDPFRQSAVIAYYSIFSLPALLVIIVAFAGLFIDAEVALSKITGEFGRTMGNESAKEIETMVNSAKDIDSSIWALVIGCITLLFGATSVFAQFQKILNLIFDVKAQPKQSILKTIKDRVFSFGLIVSIGFLLIVSLVFTSALTAFSDWAGGFLPDWALFVFHVLNFILSLGLLTLMFALIFKILPDVVTDWNSIWPGALVTAILFEIGKYALSLYFGKADPGADYGVAASIVLMLLWVSYSCMIVFYGAEFTKQNILRVQGGITPARDAVKIPAMCGEFL
jgi:membrane protein